MLDLSRLSAEQRRVVLAPDGPMLVLAGPGSGKTTVLAARVAYLVAARGVGPRSVLALVFTTSAARELRARLVEWLGEPGRLVDVATLHAFGLRVVRHWSAELGFPHPRLAVCAPDEARALLREAGSRIGLRLPTADLAETAARVDRHRLGQGASTDAGPIGALADAYEGLLRQHGAIDFPGMVALPLRLLEGQPAARRVLEQAYRHLLADEAQDVAVPQYRLIKLLAARHRNLALVGDPRQCVPAGTLIRAPGGEFPVEAVRAGDEVVGAAGRGRTAVARVQDALRHEFHGELVRVTTRSGRVVRLTADHICFARLGRRTDVHYVYLMFRRDLGYRIGVAISARPEKRTGMVVGGLLCRSNQERAEKVWVLRVCGSRQEASFHEQLLSTRYGVPTVVFQANGRQQLLDQAAVKRLFAAIDTPRNAARLMADLRVADQYPHHRPQALTLRGEARRRQVHLAMFGSRPGSVRSPWFLHRVWLNSGDASTKHELERRGLRTRSDAKGGWRIDRQFTDLGAAVSLSEHLAQTVAGADIARTAMLTTGPCFSFQPASHLHPTMVLPIVEGDSIVEDEIVSVEREPYDGPVYDLNVEHLHNYCAGDVVVHNCLYSWRGADARCLRAFPEDFPDARTFGLTENFRSTGRIVALANALGAPLGGERLWTRNPAGEPPRLREAPDERGEAAFVVEQVRRLRADGVVARLDDVAVLYRTNRQADALALALRSAGLPYRVRPRGDPFARREVRDALAYLRLAQDPENALALARVANTPPRGLGRLASLLRRTPIPAGELPALARGHAPATIVAAEALVSLVHGLHAEAAARAPGELLDLALDRSGYRAWLAGQPDGPARLQHLAGLRALAEGAEGDLTSWLADLAVDGTTPPEGRDDERVLLATVHGAKGGEWSVVFVVGCEQGLLPLQRSGRETPSDLDEERRIAFVAVTRPRHRLYLSYCRERTHDGRRESRRPSPYLGELPPGLLGPAA